MATLGYWGNRGLAQPIRFLLAYLGVQYTEKIYQNPEEWFNQDKKTLALDFPNIPYYIDNDIKITESTAIPYYLIKKNKRVDLIGQNPDGTFNEKEIRIQQVIGVIKDISKEISGLCASPDFQAIKDKLYQEKFSVSIQKLIGTLGNKEFLVGNLSFADFLFYELLNYFKYIFPQSINGVLNQYIARFENLPGIKQYLAKPTVNLKVFLPAGKFAWSGPQ